MHVTSRQLGAALAALLLFAACSDGAGSRVGLAFSTRPAPGGAVNTALVADGATAAVAAPAQDEVTVITLGNTEIIIRKVELVLRDIELERLEVADCADTAEDDDGCEEFESGPLLVTLPLGGATERQIAITVPAGIYDELEFEVHKPDEVEDAQFILDNPDFADISIRVIGTYSQGGTSSDFVFTSDLNEEQEIDLLPALDVPEGGAVNVTLRLDISTWFLNASRTALVNPASANKGGPNENLVRDNIRASIDAFRDNDSDGLDDDSEEG